MSIPGSRATPPDTPGTRPPDPARLLLIRHGQSTWNDERRIQGQLDPPLSMLGREQARRLAVRLARRQFEAFYCSDLRRTRETAEEIARAIGREPVLMPGLREVMLGDWEGLRTEDIEKRFPEDWLRWRELPSWDIPPGGEGAQPFEARVHSVIDEILGRHPHGETLIVTHGGVIQVALGRLFRSTSDGLFPFVIDNCSISTLLRGPFRSVIAGVNDTCHLVSGQAPHSARPDRPGGLGAAY
jgi:probable phosphoglycerate mutase